MAVAAIIPARFASTRLPAKPFADIHGRPMVQHVYERASRAVRIDRVVVATDDRPIADAVRAFGGEVVMTSADHASGTDRIAEAARALRDAGIVVNEQGDAVSLPLGDALMRFAGWPKAPLEETERLEQLRALHNGLAIRVVEVAGAAGVAVDTPDDLERVRDQLAGRA